jgi:hypothetical protein
MAHTPEVSQKGSRGAGGGDMLLTITSSAGDGSDLVKPVFLKYAHKSLLF